MNLDDSSLPGFLRSQLEEYGGKVPLDQGAWVLFAVEAGDEDGQGLARDILADAPFPHESGVTEDDCWTLYFVTEDARTAAIHWLTDLHLQVTGGVRLPSPAQRRLIQELVTSKMPHRLAQQLAEQHERGELSAGCIYDPATIRALLDRLHTREPLFYSAFHKLFADHLIDLPTLLQQLMAEDVALLNESISASVSRDPFIRTGQNAAAELRQGWVQFHLINALDQQKNTAIRNPYAAYLDMVCSGEELSLQIDGIRVPTAKGHFVQAIQSTRRNLYRGAEFNSLNTQVPWMSKDIAYSFRFIKQRLDVRRELRPLDGLYMLERAVAI
jgi:hypothetical protein